MKSSTGRRGPPKGARARAKPTFDKVADARQKANYSLRLYVTNREPRSLRAIENLRRICDEHLEGRCQIEVVDLLKHPEVAGQEEILAVPTLARTRPGPVRMVIGDLSDTRTVLSGLDIGAPRGVP